MFQRNAKPHIEWNRVGGLVTIHNHSTAQTNRINKITTKKTGNNDSVDKNRKCILDMGEMWDVHIHILFPNAWSPVNGTERALKLPQLSFLISIYSWHCFALLRYAFNKIDIKNLIVRIMCHITFHCLFVWLSKCLDDDGDGDGDGVCLCLNGNETIPWFLWCHVK